MNFERIEVKVPAGRGNLPEIVAQSDDGGATWRMWTIDGRVWEPAAQLEVTEVVWTTPRGTKRTKRQCRLGLRERRLPETVWLENIIHYGSLRQTVASIAREVRRGAWWSTALSLEWDRCRKVGVNPHRVASPSWNGGGPVAELAALQRARRAATTAEVPG